MNYPEGMTEISRWQAQRRHRNATPQMCSAPAGAMECRVTTFFQHPCRGARNYFDLIPGAASTCVDLPPANFRQPSGLAEFCPGGTTDISRWSGRISVRNHRSIAPIELRPGRGGGIVICPPRI